MEKPGPGIGGGGGGGVRRKSEWQEPFKQPSHICSRNPGGFLPWIFLLWSGFGRGLAPIQWGQSMFCLPDMVSTRNLHRNHVNEWHVTFYFLRQNFCPCKQHSGFSLNIIGRGFQAEFIHILAQNIFCCVYGALLYSWNAINWYHPATFPLTVHSSLIHRGISDKMDFRAFWMVILYSAKFMRRCER